MKILYNLLLIGGFFNTTIHCQSLIKFIDGDLYINSYDSKNLISNSTLKNNLINFELKNDVKYLFSTNKDFAIIKLNINENQTEIMIEAKDFPDGFVINNLESNIVKNQKQETNWIWDQLVEMLNNPFENKNQYDNLYTTSGMGITRDLFSKNQTHIDVIPNSYISIDSSENRYIIKENCEKFNSKNIIKNNDEILIDFGCDSIIIDDQKGKNILLVQTPISNEINIAYNMLSENLNDKEKIFSELILIDLLIKNNYIYNAKYLIKNCKNDLISDYFDYIED